VSRLWLWGPVWIHMGLIFILSSIPYFGALPGNISDKTGHSVGYAVLGILLVRALAHGRASAVTLRTALLAVLLATAYGISDECHQWFVPGRSADMYDAIADAEGAAVASLGVWAILKIASHRQRNDDV
jgi:VanZ family protein